MLIDFCQFLYDTVEKVLFKADFFFFLHDRNPKANTTNTPNYESSCEKVTGSNVINDLKGGLVGGAPPPPHSPRSQIFSVNHR